MLRQLPQSGHLVICALLLSLPLAADLGKLATKSFGIGIEASVIEPSGFGMVIEPSGLGMVIEPSGMAMPSGFAPFPKSDVIGEDAR